MALRKTNKNAKEKIKNINWIQKIKILRLENKKWRYRYLKKSISLISSKVSNFW
jgi:hypothetical protein